MGIRVQGSGSSALGSGCNADWGCSHFRASVTGCRHAQFLRRDSQNLDIIPRNIPGVPKALFSDNPTHDNRHAQH